MRKTNVQKVADAIGGIVEGFSDKSLTWIHLEDDKHVVNIEFDGKGNKFIGITVHKKIYQVVDEELIAEIKVK